MRSYGNNIIVIFIFIYISFVSLGSNLTLEAIVGNRPEAVRLTRLLPYVHVYMEALIYEAVIRPDTVRLPVYTEPKGIIMVIFF